MSDHNPTSAGPTARPWRERVVRFHAGADRVPDRRGEAFQIFTTIFVRPALELRDPIRRLARDLAGHNRTSRIRVNPDQTRAARVGS